MASGWPFCRQRGRRSLDGLWMAVLPPSWGLREREARDIGVRANESRLSAMLDAALDAVVTMNGRSDVVGWNHAAETIFGFSIEEALGRDMGELIVPPSLRNSHPTRPCALPRTRHAGDPRPPVRADRHAEKRRRVPGRAHDHADRPARPGLVH